ncbi:MAG: hypothetical protein AAGI30_07760 [Planctomycetota bacterium]
MPNKLCETSSEAQNGGSTPLARGIRFGIWVALVAGALLVPIAFASTTIGPAWTVAASGALLLGFLALLETTPPGAITLPPPLSVAILWAGSLWCVFAAAGLSPTDTLASASFVALVCFAAITPIGGRLSTWYAALVLWSPAVYAAVGVELFEPAWWALKACIVATALSIAALPDRWRRPVLGAALVASSIVAALITRPPA